MKPHLRDLLPKPEHATRYWWVRHARVPEVAHRMYGSLDVDCDTSDTALFEGIAARLPANALWVTSPLKRTHQTAEALIDAGATAAEWAREDAIREQDFGDFNGMTHEELFAQREDAYLGFWPLPPEQQAPNGESFSMLRHRVEGFIERMNAAYQGRDLVCVAHRGTILARAADRTRPATAQQCQLRHRQRLADQTHPPCRCRRRRTGVAGGGCELVAVNRFRQPAWKQG